MSDSSDVKKEGYEYYVIYQGEVHRGPWSEVEVEQWIAESLEEGFRPGAFCKARRKVGEIEVYE